MGDKVPDEVRQFNAFLAEQKAEEERQRQIADAERTKARAAEVVRTLAADERATREQKTEAERAYREAVEAWQQAVHGDAE